MPTAKVLLTNDARPLKKGLTYPTGSNLFGKKTGPPKMAIPKSDLQDMKDAGIKSLRLPIQFAAVVDTVAPYTVDTAHVLFSRVDTVIAWATELDMRVIIDNHHGWDLTTENWRSKMDAFTHLWSVLAQRYSTLDPEMFTFELLNEPAILFPNDSLRIIFSTAIDSIRQHTTAHTIIVSPHFGSSALASATNATLCRYEPDLHVAYLRPARFYASGFDVE
jgi:aryl-phospho-beta-D-glucosidase BglC (GH1 family)